jgi:methionyl-tRNA formyltransferase
MNPKDIKIVFMGTPDFAVGSLKKLVEEKYKIVGVVTATDKPAGRGQKLQSSAVKQYAESQGIPILQPEKLKDENFQKELKNFNADLFIVVAFRMLPKSVWAMPKFGTINLHASLLPQYRGAAPINWAIINGETKSGVTTFFIEEQIDTGNILLNKEVEISDTDNVGILHDKLMDVGSNLICETVDLIATENYKTIPQAGINEPLKSASKIFKDDCKINWNKPAKEIYNLIRGLSPYPAAWTEFVSIDGKEIQFKIFESELISKKSNEEIGRIISDNKSFVHIVVQDGIINIKTLQQAGKNKMKAEEFLRGFQQISNFKVKNEN